MIAGLGGGVAGHSVTLATPSVLAVCAEERLTRVRGGGGRARPPAPSGDVTLQYLLERLGRSLTDVTRVVGVEMPGEPDEDGGPMGDDVVDHHRAHASTTYRTSPFASAAILVCDREPPYVSVWQGNGAAITPIDWPWLGMGFAQVFSRCAAAFGFRSAEADQRFEALARLSPRSRDQRADQVLTGDPHGLALAPDVEARVAGWLGADTDAGSPRRAALAAALQARLADLLLDLVAAVQARTGTTRLCLGGSLFYHSSMNTTVRLSGLWDEVFIPVDPGNSGLSCGAALESAGAAPDPVSPFLGPHYAPDEIKAVLDNCKLQYSWESEGAVVAAAVDALQHGRLVGWFDGAMEWGPRALGGRCILGNPGAPYVLENLNRYLKQRQPWRGYALSGLAAAVATQFTGPAHAPFMECDYEPRDRRRFRHLLPAPDAAVRVHTVDHRSPPRFRQLLEAMGDATGLPMVVNTSFNGFHEPIVCSPRDAVRVFYGTGVDLLIIDRFIIRK